MSETLYLDREDGLAFIRVMSKLASSQIPEADLSKLNDLVGLTLPPDFYFLREKRCTNCDKILSFFDVAKTSVDHGIHSPEFLRHLFSGDQFIVRTGQGGEAVDCSNCGTAHTLEIIYACPVYLMWH